MNRDQFKGFAHLFALYMSESYVYEFTRISPGSQTVFATFYIQADKELASKMSGVWAAAREVWLVVAFDGVL